MINVVNHDTLILLTGKLKSLTRTKEEIMRNVWYTKFTLSCTNEDIVVSLEPFFF